MEVVGCESNTNETIQRVEVEIHQEPTRHIVDVPKLLKWIKEKSAYPAQISTGIAVIGDQILPDGLGIAPMGESLLDQLEVRFTGTCRGSGGVTPVAGAKVLLEVLREEAGGALVPEQIRPQDEMDDGIRVHAE